MNATRQQKRSSGPSDSLAHLLESLERLATQASPDVQGGARSALELCVLELEEILPELTEFLGTESLLSAGFGYADQQRVQEHLAEGRSKFRELRALLESGHRLLREHPTPATGDEPARALNAYLVACALDTAAALRGYREEFQRQPR